MLHLQEVLIKGFKSFYEEVRWVLPEQPGLYMIAGDNQVAPQLHSNGCVAAETLLYDPVEKRLRRVDEIHDPFHVWARNPVTGRREIGCASAPFVKGVADLYRVTLSNGQSFVATLEHRVLAAHGEWDPVGKLRPNAELVSGGNCLCDTHCQHTLFSADGSLPLPGNGQAVDQYLRQIAYHADAIGEERYRSTGSEECGCDPVSRAMGMVRLITSQDVQLAQYDACGSCFSLVRGQRFGGMECGCGWFHAANGMGSQDRLTYGQYPRTLGDHSHTTISFRLRANQRETWSEPVTETTKETINCIYVTSIEFVRQDTFYDIRVPFYDNYELAGAYHHNSGKSTLIEAIPWCFYGKTTRGLRLGEVVSWNGQESPSVAVKYQRGTQSHIMRRSTNPGSLVLDDSNIDQDTANNHIGLNFDCFSFAVLIGQFARQFIDIVPAEKLALFSFVMGLDYWQDCAARAKQAAVDAAATVTQASNTQASIKGRYEEVSDRLASLDAIITRSRRQLEEDRNRLELDIASHDEEIAVIRRDTAWMRRKVLVAQRAIDDALEAKIDSQRRVDGLVGQQAAAAANVNGHGTELARLVAEVDRLKRAYPRCVECGQHVSRDHYDAELATRQARVTTAKIRRAELEAVDAQVKRTLADARTALVTAERTVTTLQRSKREMETKIRCADTARNQLDFDLKHLKKDVRRLEETANSNGERTLEYEETLANLRTLGASMHSCLMEIRVAKRRERFMDFWATRGFKNLRLSIMNDALCQLEVNVNSDAATLGLDGWNVEFVVERKTKTGTLSHGMQTLIIPPGENEAIRWESYSGGECQRLRMATTTGMIKLVSDYAGTILDCEFYDEPTTHLNTQGVLDLLEYLRTRARTESKRIFIIDHRSLDAGLFDGVCTITKDATGSHIGPWQ